MQNTDERRRPQGYDRPPRREPPHRGQRPAPRPEHRGPRQEEPVRRRREYENAPRREEYEYRSREAAPRRREDPRDHGPRPRTGVREEPPRRRPPQAQEEYQRRDPDDLYSRPRSRGEAERRRRREEERRRRQRRRQAKILAGLMMVVVAVISTFCLYAPPEVRPDRGEISHLAKPTEPPTEAPTEAPTEPPYERPSRPPIEVTPISGLEDLAALQVPDFVDVQIIDVDGDSRRGYKLEEINDIVLHYVGNTGTTAQQNRDWYADIYSDVSSHFVVGLEGEVIQAIPLDEKSSASNHRNRDTISIEVCHPDDSGKFADATYDSVVELIAWLVKACDLEMENVIRHYEVTGKVCPKYYVENDDAWQQMLADIRARVEQE